MKILIVDRGKIPVLKYGGTERVIWDLGKALSQMGHEIFYLVKSGSVCNFGKILPIDETVALESQIPDTIDIVHFHCVFDTTKIKKPYVFTMHGNAFFPSKMIKNTIFVSQNHAERYNSNCFVNNGLDWDNYSDYNSKTPKTHFHFLGKARWKVKNAKGAMHIIRNTKNEKLKILGGNRNLKYGVINNIHPRIRFEGSVGGPHKDQLLNASKGLIFPVRWHEPFGLAIIETLYFGGAVFGSTYGSLPNLVTPEVGFLANSSKAIINKIENDFTFSAKTCHDYAVAYFNHQLMAKKYLSYYEQALNGVPLNQTAPMLISKDDSNLLPWN